MISAASFWTSSLRAHPWGGAVTRILAAAIAAVEPATAVHRAVQRQFSLLTVGAQRYNLQRYRRLFLFSLGKAAVPMAAALAELLGSDLTDGLVIAKRLPERLPQALASLTVLTGNHPVPGEASLQAGERALTFLSSLKDSDLLFCLISGGGSALMTAPLPGLSLDDLQTLNATLLACGAPIQEINLLRRHLDRLKGGGLVAQANGATVVSLILSDVIGNPLEVIASGPTVPDPTSPAEAWQVISRYHLQGRLPASILSALQTPWPKRADFGRVQNIIIGDNRTACQAALRQAEEEGFQAYFLGADFQGEARQVALELVEALYQSWLGEAPFCLVGGGETTVTLQGGGRGGRNTELALAAVPALAARPGALLISLATDGEDGPTDAAGAVVTSETWQRAQALGLDPQAYLARNDSYSFFAALDDLLQPGPTGTNVNDLFLLLRS